MNTYWDLRVRDLMDRNGMAERHRRVFEHHGLQACDVMLADSTTRRAIMVRMVLKEGARHTLLTTVDTVLGPSMWQRMVFDTFLPADTVFRLPVLDSKAALYLGDLSSEEKKAKDRAKASLSVIIFRDADADVLIQHFEGTAWRKEELKERAAMLRECGAVKNERVLPFLERAYLAAGTIRSAHPGGGGPVRPVDLRGDPVGEGRERDAQCVRAVVRYARCGRYAVPPRAGPGAFSGVSNAGVQPAGRLCGRRVGEARRVRERGADTRY
jgi:hypothetical protein